jgi:hypothetical protein
MFQLRISSNEVKAWSDKYIYDTIEGDAIGENHIRQKIVPNVHKRGYFLKDEFLVLGRWKSPRPILHYSKNSQEYIAEVTKASLQSNSEQFRIEVLTLLSGVSWPVASTILHFVFENQYPILDFRALWSLGINEAPAYDFTFWQAYVKYCQELAETHKLSIRQLDKALWQYSKENQK